MLGQGVGALKRGGWIPLTNYDMDSRIEKNSYHLESIESNFFKKISNNKDVLRFEIYKDKLSKIIIIQRLEKITFKENP